MMAANVHNNLKKRDSTQTGKWIWTIKRPGPSATKEDRGFLQCKPIAAGGARWQCELVVLAWAVLSLAAGYCQTNAPASHGRSNRYLLIVETSRSMQRRSAGVLESVQDLLASRMGGQLKSG